MNEEDLIKYFFAELEKLHVIAFKKKTSYTEVYTLSNKLKIEDSPGCWSIYNKWGNLLLRIPSEKIRALYWEERDRIRTEGKVIYTKNEQRRVEKNTEKKLKKLKRSL